MAAPEASRGKVEAWRTALRLLSRRDYGSAELRRALHARGADPEAAEAAVARATGLGYLDDARYGARLVRSLLDSGKAAGPRLAMELRRRGLDEELIATLLADAEGGDSTSEALRALLVRRFPAFTYTAAAPNERRRVIHFLQRRGFPLDLILTELKRNDS